MLVKNKVESRRCGILPIPTFYSLSAGLSSCSGSVWEAAKVGRSSWSLPAWGGAEPRRRRPWVVFLLLTFAQNGEYCAGGIPDGCGPAVFGNAFHRPNRAPIADFAQGDKHFDHQLLGVDVVGEQALFLNVQQSAQGGNSIRIQSRIMVGRDLRQALPQLSSATLRILGLELSVARASGGNGFRRTQTRQSENGRRYVRD